MAQTANLTPLEGERRAILTAGTSVWCLRFPTGGDYKDFLTEWDDALFENSYGKEATPANRRKVFGEDFENWASGEDPEVSQPRTERSALWVTACRGDNGRGAGR